jgi:hypothetical protein
VTQAIGQARADMIVGEARTRRIMHLKTSCLRDFSTTSDESGWTAFHLGSLELG